MGGPDYTRTERSRRWRARKKSGYKILRIRLTQPDVVKLTALGYCQGATLAEAIEAWWGDSLAAAQIPTTRDGTRCEHAVACRYGHRCMPLHSAQMAGSTSSGRRGFVNTLSCSPFAEPRAPCRGRVHPTPCIDADFAFIEPLDRKRVLFRLQQDFRGQGLLSRLFSGRNGERRAPLQLTWTTFDVAGSDRDAS